MTPTDLHRLAGCGECGRQFDVSDSPELGHLAPGDAFRCSCGSEVTVPTGRPHDAAVAACSACGAPREGRAAACTYCGSSFTLRELDLDAICPSCFARVSRRGRFCHHCAVPLTAPRGAGGETDHHCPACPGDGAGGAPSGGDGDGVRRPRVSRRLGQGTAVPVFECRTCAGLWLDRQVFSLLVEQVRSRRAALDGTGAVALGAGGGGGAGRPGGGSSVVRENEAGWSYRPCAVCGQLMNRRQYAGKSRVILDICKDHGLWFDADELHQVLEWVRQGGATDADVQAARRLREESRSSGPSLGGGTWSGGGSWAEGSMGGGRRGWGFDVVDLLVVLSDVAVDVFGFIVRD